MTGSTQQAAAAKPGRKRDGRFARFSLLKDADVTYSAGTVIREQATRITYDTGLLRDARSEG